MHKAALHCLTISLSLGVFAGSGTAQERPAGTLKTRWASEVSPSLPLNDYPRPQLRRENWINLNGPWQYAIVPKDQDVPESWDGTILVPFAAESQLSGVQRYVGKENRLWYQREFDRPNLSDGERLLLHFGAVDWHATVWVNDRQIGEHRGGYDAFTFDITDALSDESSQTLRVAVWDPSDKGYQPRGKQRVNPHGIWYTSVTGIWQTVWLETVPGQYVDRLKITPDIDNKRLTVSAHVPNASGEAAIEGTLIENSAGVANAKVDVQGTIGELVFEIEEPKLWSPNSPFLYDLKIDLLVDGQVVDSVASYCGLRKSSMKKDARGIDRLALNNEIVFHCGPLDQGWWPDGLYTAPTDEALRYDIEVMKELGFNAVRKHVKVEPARWYYWADKLGLLVWQDMPNAEGNTPVGGPEYEAAPEAAEQFRAELKAMVERFYNHPSIVIWVPFNEGWGQHNTNDNIRWVQELDPTRLVDGPSGWMDYGYGDLIDIHRYPGPAVHPPVNDRVSVLSEFGGVGRAVEGHLWKEDNNWGYLQTRTTDELQQKYEELYEQLKPMTPKGLSAAIYTQLTDVEIEVNGLLTYDRAVIKFDVDRLKELHEELYNEAVDAEGDRSQEN